MAPLLTTLEETLDSFVEIGLGYLSLDRPSGTLSGGESQRTKMIRHLGSSLTDITYVFDEPTIGLHPHDIQRMNDLLLRLRDRGNTVLLVEHKPETIEIADHVVDLGPGAGTAAARWCSRTVDGLRASGTIAAVIWTTGPPQPSVGHPWGAGGAWGKPTTSGRGRRHPACVLVWCPAWPGRNSLILDRYRDGTALSVDQTPIRGSRRSNPATCRAARPDPYGVRQGQWREASCSVQLRGRLPTCNGAGVIYTGFSTVA